MMSLKVRFTFQVYPCMGASIYYVRRIFGILDPLPPLVRSFTQPISLIVRKIGHFFHPPHPPWCERNKWIAPNVKCVKLQKKMNAD